MKNRILKLSIHEGSFRDTLDREVVLRGINFAAEAKLPAKPFTPSHAPLDEQFFDGDNVSFVNSPCTLDEIDGHLERLRSWGFNTIRYIFTWEALEHKGPGVYDEEFIDFTIQVLYRLKHFGFYVIMDPHQDCWSRYCGGSGAPLWTHYAVGLDPQEFKSTQAALLENHFLTNPNDKPKMLWSSNYTRLAASTLFTLFFAGKTFAPKCIINGVNIQDYLESHFINACRHFARRIHAETEGEGLNDSIIGWESMNEPGHGYIGNEDISEIPKCQQVKLYTVPTGAQGMALGSGIPQTMPRYEFGSMGPKIVESQVKVDPKGAKVWLLENKRSKLDEHYGWKRGPEWEAGRCIWNIHGVWIYNNGFELKKKNYFAVDNAGKAINHSRFVDEIFTNHWIAYRKALREAVPEDSFMFFQPPVLAKPPPLKQRGLVDKYMVYAPHYYDGLTLMLKHWNRNFNVDAMGVIRGKYANPPVMAVRLGERNIRKCLGDQLSFLRQEGINAFGAHIPCVVTEIGVPYDMDEKEAYKTGDFSSQMRSMDANNFALECATLSHTLWVYATKNTNKEGDNWNGEDLSIWSKDPVKTNEASPSILKKIRSKTLSLELSSSRSSMGSTGSTSESNESMMSLAPPTKNCADPSHSDSIKFYNPIAHLVGARAPEAFIRPVPVNVSGKIVSYRFVLAKSKFTLQLIGSGKVHPNQKDNDMMSLVPTVVYLPTFHFPVQKTGVSTSAGIWQIDRVNQMLYWWHLEGPQTLVVTGLERVRSDGAAMGFGSGPSTQGNTSQTCLIS